jgi:hypothetical protein
MIGFGWNFYGFFVFAAVWIAAYFLWAYRMARIDSANRESRATRRGSGRK